MYLTPSPLYAGCQLGLRWANSDARGYQGDQDADGHSHAHRRHFCAVAFQVHAPLTPPWHQHHIHTRFTFFAPAITLCWQVCLALHLGLYSYYYLL